MHYTWARSRVARDQWRLGSRPCQGGTDIDGARSGVMNRLRCGQGPAGLRSKYVPLGEDGTLIPITGVIGDNGIFPVTDRTLFKGRDGLYRYPRLQAMFAAITLDTINRLCVTQSIGSNSPALHIS